MRIAVLMGGCSPEREVSLASGAGIASALEQRGHEVLRVDPVLGPDAWLSTGESPGRIGREPPSLKELPPDSEKRMVQTIHALGNGSVDLAFIALHGGAGEDGRVQSVLELTGLPYTGSGVLACALAMNKALAKTVFRAHQVSTPDGLLLQPQDSERRHRIADSLVDRFGLPLVVKPNNQGSTVGFSLVRNHEEIVPALEKAWCYGDALIEPYISGREVTVAVLADEALPVVEIVPEHGVYDYECKYTSGKSQYIVPAELPKEVESILQDQALRAFRSLGCSGYARVDFRLREDNVPFCLEVNTAPGMTSLSLVPKAARARGIEFDELCDRIVHMALQTVRK